MEGIWYGDGQDTPNVVGQECWRLKAPSPFGYTRGCGTFYETYLPYSYSISLLGDFVTSPTVAAIQSRSSLWIVLQSLWTNYFVLLKLAMPRFRPQNKIDFSKIDLLVGPISFIPKGTMGQVLMNVSCDSSVNIPSQMPHGLPLNGSTCKSIVPRCRDTTSVGDSVKASTS